jgi:hypothetical protein
MEQLLNMKSDDIAETLGVDQDAARLIAAAVRRERIKDDTQKCVGISENQKIEFIFDSEPVIKVDEPGVMRNLCHKFVTEYQSIS